MRHRIAARLIGWLARWSGGSVIYSPRTTVRGVISWDGGDGIVIANNTFVPS